MRVRVIDLETTGLAPPAEICELAFIDLGEGGRELCRYSSLVRPFASIDPCSQARAVHHLSDAENAGAPRWPQVAFHISCAFPQPDVLVAHRTAFERQWLSEIFHGVPWICTFKSTLRVWPDAPQHTNQVLRYYLGIDVPVDPLMPAHRALCHCVVTAEIFKRLLDEHATIDEMIAWEREPTLNPRIWFGKHKGKAWRDVPADYLRWIVAEGLTEEAKFCAARELQMRKAPCPAAGPAAITANPLPA
jgi:exodeoxyribonuclease X